MTDDAHMRHALALGARGLGQTWPNPAVGCVIVQGDRIVGRGWTQPGGRPHAEQMALDQAGAAARGATAYVTLEPCAHHGHTPPCAEALLAAGVARVVTALTDPDPRVSGRGHSMLRSAGIAVTENVCAGEAAAANAGFLKRVTRGMPFVTVKLGMSLDGRIAMAGGESRWITGPASRRRVHAMRMAHDAVMVGSGTAVADDPDLTVRDLGAQHQPVRILIDGHLRHSAASRLGQTARQSPVWVLHAEGATAANVAAWGAAGATCIAVPATGGHVDIRQALGKLAERGITRILVEGGAGLAGAIIRAGLADQLALFSGGVLIGADGTAAIAPLIAQKLGDAPRLTLQDIQQTGGDTFSLWSFD